MILGYGKGSHGKGRRREISEEICCMDPGRTDGGLVKHTTEMLGRVESRHYGNFRYVG